MPDLYCLLFAMVNTPVFDADKATDFMNKRLSTSVVTAQEQLSDIMDEESSIVERVKTLTRDIKDNTLSYEAAYPDLGEFLSLFLNDMKRIKSIFFNDNTEDAAMRNMLAYYKNKVQIGEKQHHGKIELEREEMEALMHTNREEVFPLLDKTHKLPMLHMLTVMVALRDEQIVGRPFK